MIIMFWTSIISDFEFDLKLKELQELENKYPDTLMKAPTQRVGGAITKILKLFPSRMYSLDNSYSKEDLIDWENGTEGIRGCSIRIYL
jgi:DNA ligase (NAD+)